MYVNIIRMMKKTLSAYAYIDKLITEKIFCGKLRAMLLPLILFLRCSHYSTLDRNVDGRWNHICIMALCIINSDVCIQASCIILVLIFVAGKRSRSL